VEVSNPPTILCDNRHRMGRPLLGKQSGRLASYWWAMVSPMFFRTETSKRQARKK